MPTYEILVSSQITKRYRVEAESLDDARAEYQSDPSNPIWEDADENIEMIEEV